MKLLMKSTRTRDSMSGTTTHSIRTLSPPSVTHIRWTRMEDSSATSSFNRNTRRTC